LLIKLRKNDKTHLTQPQSERTPLRSTLRVWVGDDDASHWVA
jgi:hypothetical protein